MSVQQLHLVVGILRLCMSSRAYNCAAACCNWLQWCGSLSLRPRACTACFNLESSFCKVVCFRSRSSLDLSKNISRQSSLSPIGPNGVSVTSPGCMPRVWASLIVRSHAHAYMDICLQSKRNVCAYSELADLQL